MRSMAHAGVVEVHVAAHVDLQAGFGQRAGHVFGRAAHHLHLARAQQRRNVVGRVIEELAHREVAEGHDLLARGLAARHHVFQPRDDVLLVRQHLVVAGVARPREVVGARAGGHVDVGIDGHEPDAFDRFDDIAGVGHRTAQAQLACASAFSYE
ncbi:hypothetical protein G6F65_017749 [Rhizopus arrhizus]|nr:hypothetical protein G6F65_017749 [Rhizopus arrhizus]